MHGVTTTTTTSAAVQPPPLPTPTTVLRAHRAAIHSLCFLQDNTLVSADASGDVLVWNLDQKRVSHSLVAAHGEGIGLLNVTSETESYGQLSCRFATQARDGSVKFWSSPDKLSQGLYDVVLQTESTCFAKMSVAWLADGEILVCNAMENESDLGVWECHGDLRAVFRSPRVQDNGEEEQQQRWGMIMDTKLVLDGRFVCVVYEDGFLRVCDVNAGGISLYAVQVVERIGIPALALDWWPLPDKTGDHIQLWIGTSSMAVAVLDLDLSGVKSNVTAAPSPIVRFIRPQIPIPESQQPNSVGGGDADADDRTRGCGALCVRRDGRIVVLGRWDSTVVVVHRRTCKLLGILQGHHKAAVYAVKFSPNMHTLVTGSKDQRIMCWTIYPPAVTTMTTTAS